MTRATRSRPHLWLGACICALLLSYPMGLHAQPSRDELAQSHFRSGAAYLEESDYENALRAFEKAYELSKRPELLLNIATVHERMNRLELAVSSLEQYLREDPQGRHAETVERRIENLRHRIEAQPPPAPVEAPAATPAPGPPVQPVESAPASSAPPPAPERRPSKVPAFIAFGVAGLGAVGAIATGAAAQAKHDDLADRCAPHCDDDSIRSGKTLAWTSTALTGVAVVAAGVGVTLLLVRPGRDRTAGAPARFQLSASPRALGVTASVGF